MICIASLLIVVSTGDVQGFEGLRLDRMRLHHVVGRRRRISRFLVRLYVHRLDIVVVLHLCQFVHD